MALGLFFVILAVACTAFFLVKKQIINIKLPLWKEESAELKYVNSFLCACMLYYNFSRNGKITEERADL